MPCHSSGILVDIVGINASDKGRSCEEHASCGSVLRVDTLVQFRSVQIWCNGQEETTLAVFWVMDGIDQCRVGFLPCHLLKHKAAYNGKLAQIVEFVADSDSPADWAKSHQCYGLCRAVLVEAEVEENEENVPTSPDDEDDDGMDDKEINHNKKDSQPTILPQKDALLQERKGKFPPFDSCVLKLYDILPYFVVLCCSEVLVVCCCY